MALHDDITIKIIMYGMETLLLLLLLYNTIHVQYSENMYGLWTSGIRCCWPGRLELTE